MACSPLLSKRLRLPDSKKLRERIEFVQRFLKERGFYEGEVDQNYGPGTAEAVRRFQEARGLPERGQDGVAGSDTWGEIYEVLNESGDEERFTSGLLTASQLAEIAGRPEARVDEYVQPLREVFAKYKIATPRRQAHFLAQILHETMGLRYRSEVWGPTAQQRRYDPASGSRLADSLGNTAPGDGEKYRGRGAIMVTGKDNYRTFGRAVGRDLLERPDLVASDESLYMEAAGWYWDRHSLNRVADRDDVRALTKRVNGGLNGFADRQRYLRRAKRVLRPSAASAA